MTAVVCVILGLFCCHSICFDHAIPQVARSIAARLSSTVDTSSLINSSAEGSLSSGHAGHFWPQRLKCFAPGTSQRVLTVGGCGSTIGDIQVHAGPARTDFRMPRTFWYDMSPRIQGITPPFRFHNPGDHCVIHLDVGIDKHNVRSRFSFIDIKRTAESILQDCEDGGAAQGGLAPLGSVPGWYVEVTQVGHRNIGVTIPTDVAGNLSFGEVQSTNPEIPERTPHDIECFDPVKHPYPATVDKCRPVFRNIQTSTSKLRPPTFRLVQDFEMQRQPRLPGRPPLAFAGPTCIVGLRPGRDHLDTIGRFSFEQAKDVGYEIIEFCKDRGGVGGRAPIGSPFGWVVSVFGASLPLQLEANSTSPVLEERRSVVEQSRSTNKVTSASLQGVTHCSSILTSSSRTSLPDCMPILTAMKNLPNAHQTQSFDWGQTPYVEGHGWPPFNFDDPRSSCWISIGTYNSWRIERFSIFFAAAMAEQIILQCTQGGKEFSGGVKQLRTSDGWFVSVRSQPRLQISSNHTRITDVSTSSPRLTHRVNCLDAQRNRKRITYAQCKTTIDSIKRVAKDTFNARQTFQFGRKPDVKVQGYDYHSPPFTFHEAESDCFIHLDTFHRSEVDTFSWREVWQTVKDILTFCADERGEDFGGLRLVGNRQAWYVQIHGSRIEQLGTLASSGNGSTVAA